MTEKYKPKISEAKKKAVANAKRLIEKYNVIAAVNMENLTAKQLQNMRAQLKGTVEIFMTKKRIIKIALEEEESKKKGISKLVDNLKGMPALLCSNDNPFKLFKILKKNKSSAPIKAGHTAPSDIIVPAGATGFAPGPIIGELGACKIKAGIDAGKVVIKADSLVAKEGDIISQQLAAVLLRLGVEPLEIGLDLVAAYENGEILDKSVLDIDEEKYINDIKLFAIDCHNLAIFVAHPTKDTIHHLVGKAARHAKGLAKHSKIVNKETVHEILSEAHAGATNVHVQLPKEAK
jgi:large subunit ribosomal protein L10